MMKKVIIYDDAPIIYKAINDCFKELEETLLIEVAADRETLFMVLRNSHVDIVVAEINMPDHLGIEIIESIKEISTHTEVIIFTHIVSEVLRSKAVECGALSVISKKNHIAVLAKRIHAHLEKSANAKRSQNAKLPFVKRKSMLTITERLIVHWIMLGLTSSEIAHIYGGKANTINNQKNLLLKKFHCKNTTHLIVHLLRLGYISLGTE